MPLDETHDVSLTSWLESANDPATDFPLQNLPFGIGVIEGADLGAFPCVALGDQCVDLFALMESGLLGEAEDDDSAAEFEDFLAAPWLDPQAWSGVRSRLVELFSSSNTELKNDRKARTLALRPMKSVRMLMPMDPVPNYTDFYASVHHATNVGRMFRPDNPLLPNYKWVPIGYHGRASSIVASGTPVVRPNGQTKSDDAPGAAPTPPSFGPCKMLDYELEMGLVIGPGTDLGHAVPIDEAWEQIFGMVLLNDWSARDVQKWEYQPLGPFLAKNFATSISPWVVTLDALEPFRTHAMKRDPGDPAPLPHLHDPYDQDFGAFDIRMEVLLQTAEMKKRSVAPHRLSLGNLKDLYWTPAQLVAHHTSNGCNLEPGDLMGTGTVSGPTPDSRGCLLELTWEGPGQPRKPIQLPTSESRTFLHDGDEVIFRAWCEREGFRRIGFGECRGVISPARG
ncbi:MAG: fumarylacetoacetase [Planctomycetes bacterium]|nr:fumarylacetoacetase [Planctomycetota bacterium]